jgi:hypothetical protein
LIGWVINFAKQASCQYHHEHSNITMKNAAGFMSRLASVAQQPLMHTSKWRFMTNVGTVGL